MKERLIVGIITGFLFIGMLQAAILPAAPVHGQIPSVTDGAFVSGGAVVAEAERFLGYPYAYVGASPATGFSCIGFVYYVYHQLGVNMPGDLGSAMAAYPQIPESALEPGDIVFFQNTWWPGVSHVAIYMGNGEVIHAENPQRGVTTSYISNDPVEGDYWQQHYLTAERPWGGVSVAPAPAPRQAAPVTPARPPAQIHRSVTTFAPAVHTQRWHASVRPARVPAPVRPARAVAPVKHTVAKPAARVRPVAVARRVRPVRPHAAISAVHRVLIRGPVTTARVSGLRVHALPALGAPVLTALAVGQRVSVLGSVSGWMKILANGRTVGWVYALYMTPLPSHPAARASTHVFHAAAPRVAPVTRHLETASTPHRTVRAHTSSTARSRPIAAIHIVGNTDLIAGVNVHSGPQLGAPVLGITNGEPVRVLARASGWDKVELSTGRSGWVVSRFVAGTTASVTGTPKPAVPTAAPHKVTAASTTASHPSTAAGVSVVGGIRIHSGPSLAAPAIAETPNGATAQVLGESAGFVHVRTSTGLVGWIAAPFVGSAKPRAGVGRGAKSTASTAPAAAGAGSGPYVTTTVNLRITAGTGARVIGIVPMGTHITVIGSIVGWYDVRTPSGATGYVSAQFVA